MSELKAKNTTLLPLSKIEVNPLYPVYDSNSRMEYDYNIIY